MSDNHVLYHFKSQYWAFLFVLKWPMDTTQNRKRRERDAWKILTQESTKAMGLRPAKLNHFQPMLLFCIHWKTFSGVFSGWKWKHWPEISLSIPNVYKLRRERNDNWPSLSQCSTFVYLLEISENQIYPGILKRHIDLKWVEIHSSKCFRNLFSLCWLEQLTSNHWEMVLENICS